MHKEVVGVVATQGAWALLFVYMLFYVLKNNGEREKKYQEIIENLTEQFCLVEDVQRDVREIRDILEKE